MRIAKYILATSILLMPLGLGSRAVAGDFALGSAQIDSTAKFTPNVGMARPPARLPATRDELNDPDYLTKPDTKWAGFVITQAQFGTTFAGVQAHWTVPFMTYNAAYYPATEAAQIWLGIGGYPDSDKTIVLVGRGNI